VSGTHAAALRRADEELARSPGGADPWRPLFHYTAAKGWINDPNGLVHFGGRYHMFSQHYPYSGEWGPMHWGHADSSDLLAWRRLPVALAPSEPYDLTMGCWSGSAVADGDRLSLVYTSATGAKAERQAVCVATSPAGGEFVKHPKNPVIPGPPEGFTSDFRDPRAFRYGNAWRVVVGASRAGKGCVLLYESPDLASWRLLGVLAESDGSLGHMWECPDLFPLGERWVLVVSPMGVPGVGSMALLGRLEDSGARFVIEETRVLDFGPDFYAPQTMEGPAGRRILIGWMDHWKSPDPPTLASGWRGAMTVPRVLRPGPGGRGLAIEPVEELKSWRHEGGDIAVGGKFCAGAADIEVELSAEKGSNGRLEMTLRGSPDGTRGVSLAWSAATGEVLLDPSRSGPAARKPCRMTAPARGGKLRLRAVLDRCSVEVFAGSPPDSVLSCLVFPAPGDDYLSVAVTGNGLRMAAFRAWKLAPPR